MSTPSVGLVAYWTGQLVAASDSLGDMSIHAMNDGDMALAQKYLSTIRTKAIALEKLIQEAQED